MPLEHGRDRTFRCFDKFAAPLGPSLLLTPEQLKRLEADGYPDVIDAHLGLHA